MKDINTTQELSKAEKNRRQNKSYYERNKERLSKWSKEFYKNNAEKCKEISLQSYYRNKDKIRLKQAEYWKENKEKINKKDRERRKADKEQTLKLYKKAQIRRRERVETDIQYKLSVNLRVRFYQSIKKIKNKKELNALTLAGCSLAEIKEYIEKQWLPGMNWDNYNKNGWHIDHIKPINTFDLTDLEQQKQCFHYLNLRPLWANDNLSRPKDGSDII